MELTEEELADAVRAGKLQKLERMRREETKRRQEEYRAWMERPWTYEDLKAHLVYYAQERKVKFAIDEQNGKVVDALLRYFTNDPQFVDLGKEQGEKWSLRKGILLCGNVGTGKTTLMGLFSRNKKRCYMLSDCSELVSIYNEEGSGVIDMMGQYFPTVMNDARFFHQREVGRCFDDLGTETKGMHFGKSQDVLCEILESWYKKGDYSCVHVTTNLGAKELEQRYGTRLWSRMQEMFNFLWLDGVDRRK